MDQIMGLILFFRKPPSLVKPELPTDLVFSRVLGHAVLEPTMHVSCNGFLGQKVPTILSTKVGL
jgi:hypothetical protein